jgi:hypothetical protein
MTDPFQAAYDAALFWVNAFVVSSALKRRIPLFLCVVVFLAAPAVLELAFVFAPPFVHAAFVERCLKELLLLPLIIVTFKGKFFQKTFVFFALISLAALIAVVSDFVTRLFFASGSGYELYRRLIAWGLLVLYFFLFLRFGRAPVADVYAATNAWFLYALGASLSYCSIQIAEAFFQGGIFQGVFPGLCIIAVLAALVNLVVIFSALFVAEKVAGERYELRLAQELIASGSEYYKRLDRILQEIRVLRHDYKYQLGVIDELAQISKARHIQGFLADARSHYNQTEPAIYCENLVVSALIAHYAERFEKNSVAFTVRLALPMEIPHIDKNLNPLTDYEVCIVLGNLLENAFEAAIRVPTEERRISLNISLSSGKLFVEEKNTFDGRIIAGEGRIPQSRKVAGGGYGLRSVAAVCKRHGGVYLPQWTKREYVIRLLLNL